MTQTAAQASLAEAFERLCSNLINISDKYDTAASAKDAVLAMGTSVSAVIDFLNATIRERQASKVLVYLLGDLTSVWQGQGSPTFHSVPKQYDAHTKPIQYEVIWAQAAACVTLFSANGTELNDAARTVAEVFKRKKFPLPGPKQTSAASTLDLGKKLKSWRERLKKPSSKMKHRLQLIHVHDKAVKDAQENWGDQAANQLLNSLGKMLVELRSTVIRK